jgi:hypothetical protein
MPFPGSSFGRQCAANVLSTMVNTQRKPGVRILKGSALAENLHFEVAGRHTRHHAGTCSPGLVSCPSWRRYFHRPPKKGNSCTTRRHPADSPLAPAAARRTYALSVAGAMAAAVPLRPTHTFSARKRK